MENLKEDLISIISKRVDNATYVDVADAVDEIIKKHIKELQHHRDTTVGLYAFDKELDDVFENIPNKEGCKTSVEAYLVQQIEYLKSIVFRIS